MFPSMQSNGPISQRPAWIISSRLISSWATAWNALFHYGHGCRYLNENVIIGGVIMLTPTIVMSGYDSRPLILLFVLYVGLVWYRVCGKGCDPFAHSYYDGRPWLYSHWFGVDEATFKRRIEPLFALWIGLFALGINPPLGVFLVGGAFSIATVNLAAFRLEQERILDLHDSLIEQRQSADEFRQRFYPRE